jgi:hypothetical protein
MIMIAITNQLTLMRLKIQTPTINQKIYQDLKAATTCKITNKLNPQERLVVLTIQNRLRIRTNHLTDQALVRTLKKMMSTTTGTKKAKTTVMGIIKIRRNRKMVNTLKIINNRIKILLKIAMKKMIALIAKRMRKKTKMSWMTWLKLIISIIWMIGEIGVKK